MKPALTALAFAALLATGCDAPEPVEPAALGAPVEVQLRWGYHEGAATARWDGSLSLDCGEITEVRFLDLEVADGDGVAPHHRTPQGTRVRWRSLVRGGHDGLIATLRPCAGQPGSTLRVETPHRSWRAALAWSHDDYVSLPAGAGRLEVRIAPTASAMVGLVDVE